MYTIIVYDVSIERVNKVCQFLRRYLNWIQNSVFEGEVSMGTFQEIKTGLRDLIKISEDSVVIFEISSKKLVRKEVIGVEKQEVTTIL